VRVIATSREPLGVDGEQLYPLTPLQLPDDDPLEALAGVPAVRLLLDRARAVGAELTLDEQTAPDVVEVVRRLDGLPLAIELAAARLRVLSIGEVAERLADRFRLLTGGKRTAMPRHRTLRAVVEWSWGLLDPLEREVAEHFCVFGSGATPDAVRAVAPSLRGGTAAGSTQDVVDVLHALVDKSILVAETQAGGTRFRMLETLREYGNERLAEAGTLDRAHDAHARYYAALTAQADVRLRGRDQLAALHQLDAERDNVLAALGYLGDSGDAAAALDLAVALSWYWMLRENGRDAERWMRFALAVPGAESTAVYPLARAMHLVTAFATSGDGSPDPHPAGDTSPAAVEAQQALLAELAAQLQQAAIDHPLARVLPPLLLFFAGRREAAAEAMAHNVSAADPWVRAVSLSVRLAFAENEGDLDTVRADVEAAVPTWESIGDHWGLAAIHTARGQLRMLDGDLAEAADDLETAREHLRLLGGVSDDLLVMMRLADLRLRAGDVERARQYVEQMRTSRRRGQAAEMHDLLCDVMAAGVAQAAGEDAEVTRLRESLLARLRAAGEPNQFQAHGAAVAYGYLGSLDAEAGRLPEALGHLREGYRLALTTQDLPIIATCAVSVAEYAEAVGRVSDAAAVLGAAARLRGSADHTQPRIARLTRELRDALGDAYDAAYASGRQASREQALARVDPDLLTADATDGVLTGAPPDRAGESPAQARRR
jgi:predicted ATPase